MIRLTYVAVIAYSFKLPHEPNSELYKEKIDVNIWFVSPKMWSRTVQCYVHFTSVVMIASTSVQYKTMLETIQLGIVEQKAILAQS